MSTAHQVVSGIVGGLLILLACWIAASMAFPDIYSTFHGCNDYTKFAEDTRVKQDDGNSATWGEGNRRYKEWKKEQEAREGK